MAYLIDLIAIVFIFILSFLLCMGKNSSCLSHIVVGLSVIVFYRLSKYFKLSNILKNKFNLNETFNDKVTNSINDFISNTNNEIVSLSQLSTITPIQLAEYSSKLDSLITNVNNLQNTINSPNSSIVNPSNLNTLDLASQQQYQMFQIEYLNKQIKNAQDIINAQAIADTTTNYKPIKVFSSCVVSNANGSTTTETPVPKPGSSSFSGLQQSSNGIKSSSIEKMMDTISQSNTQTQGPQLSNTAGVFKNLLSLPNLTNINL